MQFEVKRIENLLAVDIKPLLIESKEEGFRFVERLFSDYRDGTNTFQKNGEALFGVFSENDDLIAIGGVNTNPYSNIKGVGRLRRFYVLKDYRRRGIGELLVKRIIKEAANSYNKLVLHTDTKQGSAFYLALGFSEEKSDLNTTHSMKL